ncbi:hypothetical protein HPP92_002674 [Vanilla planifolia]|uniref:Uncharacterized protein n=1 Tax=Vanilla planifolia TaxID=51239 RepID=A0A835SE74_VANPL|nr:hypothetical protein HPP92_002674 [Vanilla planifolia]
MPDKSYTEIQASAHRAISVHKQIPLEAKSYTIHDDSYGEVAYKKDDKFIEGIEDDIINQMENKRTTDDETTIELGSRLTVQGDTPSKSNNTQAQENLPKFEALSWLDASVIEANQEAAFEHLLKNTQIEDGNSEERPSSHKGNNETLGQVEMEQDKADQQQIQRRRQSATELTMEDEYSGENQGDQIDSAVKMNETANDEILTIEIETDSTAGEDKLHLQDETQKATKITFNDGKQIVDTDQSAEENSQHKSNLVNDVYENPANEEAQHMNDKQEVEAEQSSMQDNKAQQNQIHERMIELDSKWSKEHHGIAGAPEKTDQEVKKCTASLGETIEQVDQNTEQISIYNAMIDNPTDIGVELVDYDHFNERRNLQWNSISRS